MPSDLSSMVELTKEMGEEAKEEIESLQSDNEPEEPLEQEEEAKIEEEVIEEKITEEAQKEEAEEPEDKKPKTPEEFKKLRLALKAKDKALADEQKEKDKLRLENAKLEGYKEASNKATPQATEAPVDDDPEPDAEYDTVNWLKWNARQTAKLAKEALDTSKQANDATRAQREADQIIRMDNEFKKVQPDYEAAVSFVLDAEKRVIKARYPGATDAQIDKHLIDEKVKLYREEYNAGRIPGERVMEMAKAYGYATAKKQNNNPEGNNQHKPNLDKIKKNMKKSSPMSGSSAASVGEIDPEAIFNMSIGKLATLSKGTWDKANSTAREIDSDGY